MTTPTDLARIEILRFLRSTEREVLCIRGKWGVGKTFSWKRYLKEAHDNDSIGVDRYSYVSLFGINSLDALKYSIFENTVRKEQVTTDASLETFKSFVESAEGWGRKAAWVAGVVPGLAAYFRAAAPAFFLAIRSQLVCIDDLERKGKSLDVADVLGLISYLKDQRHCKVALLLNDGAIPDSGREEFEKYFEKVVDVSLEFAPTPSESAQIAIVGTTTFDRLLRDNCVALEISNIRIIKRIERLARMVEVIVKDFNPGVMESALKSIALLAWVTYSTEDAPSKAFVLHKLQESYFGLNKDQELNDDETRWNDLLQRYGFSHCDELDMALLQGIERGFFDEDKVHEEAVKLDAQLRSMHGHSGLESAWRPYHDSFDDNVDEVIRSVNDGCVENVEYLSANSLDAAIRLLKDLGAVHKASELLKLFMSRHRGDSKVFDLNSNMFAGDIKDPEVIDAFNSVQMDNQTRPTPIESLRRIGGGSWGGADVEALMALSVDEFYRLFKASRGDDLSAAVLGILKMNRISNLTADQRCLCDRALESLRRIGGESPLNRRRVESFGIRID